MFWKRTFEQYFALPGELVPCPSYQALRVRARARARARARVRVSATLTLAPQASTVHVCAEVAEYTTALKGKAEATLSTGESFVGGLGAGRG